jgi:hypothetical protein
MEHDVMEWKQEDSHISNLVNVVNEDLNNYVPCKSIYLIIVGDHDINEKIKLLYPLNYEIYPMVVPIKDDYDPIQDILKTMKIVGM